MKPAILALALAALFAPSALAQNQAWAHQLGTAGAEWGTAVTPDGSGGTYVGGYSGSTLGGPGAGTGDAWLARYDGAGNQAWIRQFGTSYTEELTGVVADGAGGVFAAGWTGGTLIPGAGMGGVWLARYDGAGNQVWLRQFGSGLAEAWAAVASDGSGGVYVVGRTYGNLGGPSAGGIDAWIARFDGAGTHVWIRQLGTPSDDNAYSAALDGSGGVYVAGSTRGNLGAPNAGMNDVWLARYDGAGSLTWIRQVGTSSNELASAVTPDGSGGAYLIGDTNGGSLGGPNAGGRDAWVARYDGTGGQLWVRQLGSSSIELVYAAAADGTGGVYFGGATLGSLAGPNLGNFDVWLARYDGTGNQASVLQFGTSSYDYFFAAAPDGAGGVTLTGNTGGNLAAPPAGGTDVWLARYERDLGVMRYCNPALPNSTGQPAVIDATGNPLAAVNDLEVTASGLPQNAFGFFLTSQMQGFVSMPGGGQGNLCLAGAIGRFVAPAQVMSSGALGRFALSVDLTQMPTPTGLVAVQPGETWNFQAWHRDANPTTTSNFTDAVSVTFQ